MRGMIAGFLFASMLATGTAAAQLAPFNEVGVTMGHWHLASRGASQTMPMRRWSKQRVGVWAAWLTSNVFHNCS